MSRQMRKVKLTRFLKVKDICQWVMEIQGRFHMHSTSRGTGS